jgi:hypothetical protein
MHFTTNGWGAPGQSSTVLQGTSAALLNKEKGMLLKGDIILCIR